MMSLNRKRIDIYIFMLLAALFFILLGCSNNQAQSNETEKEVKFTWLPYDQALTKSVVENVPTLLYFYSDNCSWCRKMEKENFDNKEVQEILIEKFTSVRVNSNSSNAVLIGEQKITERQLTAELYNVTGLPTIWFLDNENQRIANLPGFVPTDTFLDILQYIGEGYYREYTFPEYLELKQKVNNNP